MDLQIIALNNTLNNVRSLPRNGGLETCVPERMYPTLCNCANRYGGTPPPVEHGAARRLRLARNITRFALLGR